MQMLSQVTRICTALYLSFGFQFSDPAYSLELHVDTKPQSTANTCQSYMASLALAAVNDPGYPINNFYELRNAELEFRRIADSLGNPYSHQTWVQAMEQFTDGKYTFKLSYHPDNIVEWLSVVKSKTSSAPDIELLVNKLTGTGFPIVLTSVKKLGSDAYSTGHIIGVIGIEGNGLNSTTKIVSFNSAIKGNGFEGSMCKPDDYPGDSKYSAGVLKTNDFILSTFGGKFVIIELVKNTK